MARGIRKKSGSGICHIMHRDVNRQQSRLASISFGVMTKGIMKKMITRTDPVILVFIHPSLSKIGRSEALSHELYGHGYIYHKYRDRNVSAHHFKGTVDTNKILKQQIIQARKETVSYF